MCWRRGGVCRVYWSNDDGAEIIKCDLSLARQEKTLDNVVNEVTLNVVEGGFRFDSLTMDGVSLLFF